MKKTLKQTLLVILGFVLIIASIFSSYLQSFIRTTDNFEMKNGIALLKEATEIATSKNGSTITALDLTLNNCGWFKEKIFSFLFKPCSVTDCTLEITVSSIFYAVIIKPAN